MKAIELNISKHEVLVYENIWNLAYEIMVTFNIGKQVNIIYEIL